MQECFRWRLRQSSDAETGNSMTHIYLGLVVCPKLHVCVSNVVSDISVTWDGVTLEFESSSHIAEGIITLAWHKQQIVMYILSRRKCVQYLFTSLVPGSLRAQTSPAFPYCKRRKAGQSLGTRLPCYHWPNKVYGFLDL